jgi:hypothetical protein
VNLVFLDIVHFNYWTTIDDEQWFMTKAGNTRTKSRVGSQLLWGSDALWSRDLSHYYGVVGNEFIHSFLCYVDMQLPYAY